MKYAALTHVDLLAHRPPHEHAEHPGRLSSILTLFEPGAALEHYPRLSARESTEAELLRVHAAAMVKLLMENRGASGWLDADTYFSPESTRAALLAAGGTIELALKIWRGELDRGFSLVRPPGHHATPQRAMGFCLLNNVALAARAILEESPQARIAIVDFDLHHGNGSQDSFYENPNVLFLSSHRFPFYPGTGNVDEVGVKKGVGTTLNFPLSRAYGREIFFPLYGGIASAVLKTFRPDILLVSAGFDGHERDPMEGFSLTTEDYGVLARMLIASAQETTGKILFVLEGGYHPGALRDSVKEVLVEMAKAKIELPKVELPSLDVLDPFLRQAKTYFNI